MAFDESLQVPGSIVVQCLDGLPMELTRIDTPPSQHAENHCPFIHLDRNFGGGWSSVYAGWAVPRFYGEYKWYGGRALVFSDGGQSLSDLEDFTSLSLVERYDRP